MAENEKLNQKPQDLDLVEIMKTSRVLDLKQLQFLLNYDKMRFFSWGVSEMRGFKDENQQVKVARLKVNGFLHKGFVYIRCNGADLFDFYLQDSKGSISKKVNDIYADQLAHLIDENIEHDGDKDKYNSMVNKTYNNG